MAPKYYHAQQDDHIVISRSAAISSMEECVWICIQKNHQTFSRWIRTKDVEYLETFATKTNHD